MITKNNKTKGMILTFLILTLGMLTLTSAALVYSDSTQYSPSLHIYDNADGVVGSLSIDTRATAADEQISLTFVYDGGASYTTPAQNVAYLSWRTLTFGNPNPSLTVTSLMVKAGTHVYFKNLNAFDSVIVEPVSEEEGEWNGLSCGNGIKEASEECDAGENNGVGCSAEYGSTCNYCLTTCKTKTVVGEFCGDGVFNELYERCDDGNRFDGDKCNNQCKKPFEVTVEDFAPLVWQCDHRVVYDDATEPGRVSEDGQVLVERINNYAFEGEQIKWRVLVMDKNGIEKIRDVYASVDDEIEANCKRLNEYYTLPGNNYISESTELIRENIIDPSCNARILEEKLKTFNPETMAYYECTLTVETFESMYGEMDVTIEAEDLDGIIGYMDEAEYWFFNPVIELAIEGEMSFDEVRPGTSAYSELVKVQNFADYGSGVVLDMFISGTDFYDAGYSGAKCPTTNQLSLENFRYYATNGAYSTRNDMQIGRTCDAEGYCTINYGTSFNNPNRFYDKHEVLQANPQGGYYASNLLYPGSEMSIILRLDLPEPCNGDFNTGQIYFWGEAI